MYPQPGEMANTRTMVFLKRKKYKSKCPDSKKVEQSMKKTTFSLSPLRTLRAPLKGLKEANGLGPPRRRGLYSSPQENKILTFRCGRGVGPTPLTEGRGMQSKGGVGRGRRLEWGGRKKIHTGIMPYTHWRLRSFPVNPLIANSLQKKKYAPSACHQTTVLKFGPSQKKIRTGGKNWFLVFVQRSFRSEKRASK